MEIYITGDTQGDFQGFQPEVFRKRETPTMKLKL